MDSKGPGPAAKVLDLQNGTKGRCRDGQRGLVEKIEALEGDKEAGGGERHPSWVRQLSTSQGRGKITREGWAISRGCEGKLFAVLWAQGRATVIGSSQGEGEMVKERDEGSVGGVKRRCLPVSYTHLTLPTSDLV